MKLFGPVHLALLLLIALVAAALAVLCRTGRIPSRLLRLSLGWGLGLNEGIWWWFRYSHEGFRFPVNLPLQLCDVTLWATVIACLTLSPTVVEFAWFAGMAGAGMALLTPDLWSPWPSYPAIYFFLVHGGIVIGVCALVPGRIVRLQPGLNPSFETLSSGTLCSERNLQWQNDEWDATRGHFVRWRWIACGNATT